jgi:hypothetical protein
MSWIESVLQATVGSESPTRYFYWSALSAISAVVKNNVYLDKFYYKLYPNIYVLLIGRSGLRKGVPISLAKALVADVNRTRVISGRSSIQAIIQDLSKAYTVENGGPPIVDAVGFMVSSEFASFLIQDPAALTVLTDLFDGHYNQVWTNTTKGGGPEKLKNVCLTLIGASNEVHFRDAVPDNALGGGFIARTFIIFEQEKSCINPLTERPLTSISVGDLSAYLKELSKVKGSFEWDKSARDVYNAWYNDFSTGTYDDSTGTIERIHDQILKAAMLISLSREPDLILRETDIVEAIRISLEAVPGVKKITMGAGKAVYAPGTAVVLKDLIARPEHEVSKTMLLQKYWGHFDTYDLDRIIQSLIDARAVKVEDRQIPGKATGNKDKWLILEPKVLENFQKLKKE